MRVSPLVLAAAFVSSLSAQSAIQPKDIDHFNTIFDRVQGDKLDCDVQTFPVFLDFSFRFEVRFIVACSLGQFGGQATPFGMLIRVSPAHAKPVLLGDQAVVPAAPPTFHNLRHLKAKVEASGAFAVGEGEYRVEFLAFDSRRMFRHSWKAKASPHGDENKADISMQPGQVSALDSLPLPAAAGRDSAHLRLTLLLHAAPMNRFSRKLRAWDRAFLLGALTSLLHEFPNASFRLVAFNLDQQQEIFREEHVDPSTLPQLSDALWRLELGTVSYRTLGRANGWSELLANLIKRESSGDAGSNAIIFLGPNGQPDQKASPLALNPGSSTRPRVFYFEYYPRLGEEFPDAIHYLTTELNGRVFKVHTPGELAVNIQKLQKELDQQFGAARHQVR